MRLGTLVVRGIFLCSHLFTAMSVSIPKPLLFSLAAGQQAHHVGTHLFPASPFLMSPLSRQYKRIGRCPEEEVGTASISHDKRVE